MIRVRLGEVLEVIEEKLDLIIARVLVDGEEEKAVHYPLVGGKLEVGQLVVLNTTAKDLGLGTGGYHFILHALGNDHLDPETGGHIMKLRYTPYQVKVLSVEEEVSPYHERLREVDSIDGMPVVVAPLHSMVTPILSVLKERKPDIRVAYLMSDGAALPLPWSRLVRSLQERDWLAGTVTFGHAFGGDYEAVNIYTALLTAKHVIGADVTIVAMGPGIIGTSTPLGFTGVEQADFLHAVHVLHGIPIALPRISFADQRERHQGMSHHSQTVLGHLTLVPVRIALPELDGEQGKLLSQQLRSARIMEKHQVQFYSETEVSSVLAKDELRLQTMGRSYAEDREFFITAGLAGLQALTEMFGEGEKSLH